MKLDFQNKTVWVTGASRGIGKAIAEAFLNEGAFVILSARSEDKLKHLADEYPERTKILPLDVTDTAAMILAAKSVIAEYIHLDVLVNSAGITNDKLVMRMSEQDWDDVLTTNLRSVFTLSREVSRTMIRQKSGSIINISSVIGLTGNSGQANYAASKAGIIAFTQSLSKEIASRNVRVNAIAPGYINTDMTAALPEALKEKMIESIAMRRIGSAEEIAQCALFLASDMASYISGQTLVVDGGMI